MKPTKDTLRYRSIYIYIYIYIYINLYQYICVYIYNILKTNQRHFDKITLFRLMDVLHQQYII